MWHLYCGQHLKLRKRQRYLKYYHTNNHNIHTLHSHNLHEANYYFWSVPSYKISIINVVRLLVTREKKFSPPCLAAHNVRDYRYGVRFSASVGTREICFHNQCQSLQPPCPSPSPGPSLGVKTQCWCKANTGGDLTSTYLMLYHLCKISIWGKIKDESSKVQHLIKSTWLHVKLLLIHITKSM